MLGAEAPDITKKIQYNIVRIFPFTLLSPPPPSLTLLSHDGPTDLGDGVVLPVFLLVGELTGSDIVPSSHITASLLIMYIT